MSSPSTAVEARKLPLYAAMVEAIRQEMTRDPTVFCMGEDVGQMGGVFQSTVGLYKEFGAGRVRDTPISETAILGFALGAAAQGMRPLAELMFVDFMGVCFDQILNNISKTTYMSGGAVKLPLVITASTGGGICDAAQHSQTLHGFFAHTPGIKVVVPSNACDAKGLMTTAIRDDSPVVYLFHRGLLGLPVMGYVESAFATEVPEESYTIPFGQARVVREGTDVTIVAFAQMVHKAVVAARELEAKAGARLRGPPHRIRARTGSHVRRLRARGHRPEAGESDDGERRRCDAAHGPGSGAQAARGAQGLMPCQGGAEPAPV